MKILAALGERKPCPEPLLDHVEGRVEEVMPDGRACPRKSCSRKMAGEGENQSPKQGLSWDTPPPRVPTSIALREKTAG